MSRDTPSHPANAEYRKCETSRALARNRQGTSTVCPKLPKPKTQLARSLPEHRNQMTLMQNRRQMQHPRRRSAAAAAVVRQCLGCIGHLWHRQHRVQLNARRRTSRQERASEQTVKDEAQLLEFQVQPTLGKRRLHRSGQRLTSDMH